ncbi:MULTISPECIES: MCE family protein [unclassified Streptomyces]|uniref:MCE family protein n=1 Tax=unclassified Streptomyces TaxID=2593676 RepID=UPI000DBAA6E2|nr:MULTISPECIES: MCE family protein [unclassified Streptomyces]MYT70869.1 MCE family protein [Streptomyces sp. SID8367]RAJ90575.1 phospholipid/cholesterol/gamma-HCH transport system substrate-binding protein [Streptomyces sp. PsTaAH-137]
MTTADRSRKRQWLKPVQERNPVLIAVAGIVALGLVALAAFNASSLPYIGGGTSYSADFSEAAGLGSGDEVRIAGVKVGEVTGVGLDGPKVKVTFKIKDDGTWIGDRTTASIAIKTLLGDKYVALDPVGTGRQDPGARIPLSRTTSPYDVTEAFQDLSGTIDEIDTKQLAASFDTISETFKDSPPDVKAAVKGLSALSKTVSSRDSQLAELLAGSKKLTKTLQTKQSSFETLINDGGSLLTELKKRRTAIKALLSGSEALGRELNGIVADNDQQLGPTLTALSRVTTVLAENKDKLDKTLSLLGPYYRLIGNTLGNGRWFDSYLCGVVPRTYLPEKSLPAKSCRPPKNGSYGNGG